MQEDSSNNNAAASPVEVWDGQAQGLEPRGVEAGVAQPLARGLTGVRLNKANAYQSGRYARVLPLRCSRRCAFNHMNSQKQFRLNCCTQAQINDGTC